MNTPICDFVKGYCEGKHHRLHMPGHKGESLLGCEALDITEFTGADVLYHAEGIIKESEDNAASLFGTARTLYSAEGSSLSIRAMVYLTAMYAKSKNLPCSILAGRNAHKVFITAAALCDVSVSFIYGEETDGLVACKITPETLRERLSEMSEKPTAVYVTSPDYLGNVVDVNGIARVCREYGVLLLVDNAHGAYLRFLPESRHPIDLGCDLCCDSAHKTLPVITGGGYLHVSKSAPDFFASNADKAMTLFASTSPSYLILQSLDKVNSYLASSYPEKLSEYCEVVKKFKARLTGCGFTLEGEEALKVTVCTKPYGYTGESLSAYLEEGFGIYAEFADPDYIVFMLTPELPAESLSALESALINLPRRTPIDSRPPKMPHPRVAMTPREALFSPDELVSLSDSVGRILAAPTVSCPPAIPIAVSGEVITEETVKVLEYYGAETVRAVKKQTVN